MDNSELATRSHDVSSTLSRPRPSSRRLNRNDEPSAKEQQLVAASGESFPEKTRQQRLARRAADADATTEVSSPGSSASVGDSVTSPPLSPRSTSDSVANITPSLPRCPVPLSPRLQNILSIVPTTNRKLDTARRAVLLRVRAAPTPLPNWALDFAAKGLGLTDASLRLLIDKVWAVQLGAILVVEGWSPPVLCTSLEFSGNQLTDVGLEHLVDFLISFRIVVKDFRVFKNDLADRGLAKVARYVEFVHGVCRQAFGVAADDIVDVDVRGDDGKAKKAKGGVGPVPFLYLEELHLTHNNFQLPGFLALARVLQKFAPQDMVKPLWIRIGENNIVWRNQNDEARNCPKIRAGRKGGLGCSRNGPLFRKIAGCGCDNIPLLREVVTPKSECRSWHCPTNWNVKHFPEYVDPVCRDCGRAQRAENRSVAHFRHFAAHQREAPEQTGSSIGKNMGLLDAATMRDLLDWLDSLVSGEAGSLVEESTKLRQLPGLPNGTLPPSLQKTVNTAMTKIQPERHSTNVLAENFSNAKDQTAFKDFATPSRRTAT